MTEQALCPICKRAGCQSEHPWKVVGECPVCGGHRHKNGVERHTHTCGRALLVERLVLLLADAANPNGEIQELARRLREQPLPPSAEKEGR